MPAPPRSRYKGRNEDIRRIAEPSASRTCSKAACARAGNRIRVTAQLIAAADGSHLWSERYDREMADVFAIQDDIAQAIAGALQVKLAAKAGAGAAHARACRAHEAVLRGRHHMLKHSPASFARANECFEQAIALDPQYGEPHANLGLNYFLVGDVRTAVAAGDDAAGSRRSQRGPKLDPSDPGPHFLLGAVAAAYDYDWEQAAEHFASAWPAPRFRPRRTGPTPASTLQPLGASRKRSPTWSEPSNAIR